MEKKYQVFISSTFVDLQNARQKVMDTILELHQIPAGMEMFPAADDDQWSHIEAEINRSDYYVLILGHRYGSVAPDGIGYTEKEYDYAREQKIPVLAFIRERDVPTQAFERESTPEAQEKLEAFIQKAKANKLVRFWNTPEDLATKVSTSLSYSFATNPRLGWVRGDQTASPEVMEELAVLSRENRRLTAELESFRKQNEKRPLITLDFNGEEQIELLIPGEIDFKPYPLPKSIEVVPQYLESFIDESAVQKYNQDLPENLEQVETYNRRLAYFTKVQVAGYELWGKIVNLGEKKANNIYVEVTFPPEVRVIKGAKKDLTAPQVPELPRHPLEEAEEKYKESKMHAMERFVKTLGSNNSSWGGSLGVGAFYNAATTLPSLNYSQLKGSTLTIHIDDLLHTRSFEFEKYTIVPGRVGEYEVKVSIICEEYSEPEIHKIPLIVRD